MPNSKKSADEMISRFELIIATSLLHVLESAVIGDEIRESPEFGETLVGLEGFIPIVLQEVDRNWSERFVDIIVSHVAYKIGERTIKIIGQCITLPSIPESTIYIRMQVDPAGKTVNWFECNLGLETSRKGQNRSRSHSERMAMIYSPDGHDDSTEWTFMVTYGARNT